MPFFGFKKAPRRGHPHRLLTDLFPDHVDDPQVGSGNLLRFVGRVALEYRAQLGIAIMFHAKIACRVRPFIHSDFKSIENLVNVI